MKQHRRGAEARHQLVVPQMLIMLEGTLTITRMVVVSRQIQEPIAVLPLQREAAPPMRTECN
jgi:hypothetical protein